MGSKNKQKAKANRRMRQEGGARVERIGPGGPGLLRRGHRCGPGPLGGGGVEGMLQ